MLEEQCEASAPENTEESETDTSVTVIDVLRGTRVVRRRVAERIFQKQFATVAAYGATARRDSRLPFEWNAVAERVRPMRC